MKKINRTSLFFVMAIVLQACYPSDTIPIADLDTTSTFYIAEDFNPAPPRSAAIFWDVARIVGGDNDLDYNGEVDDEILNTTLANLVKLYGAENVYIISETATPSPAHTTTIPSENIISDGSIPDVEAAFAPSIKLIRETVGIVYPGYPWYGGGWGCWSCGCYYCGYPPTVSYQSYDVGTILVELIDVRQLNGQIPDEFNPSWVGIFRGLVSSKASTNSSRVIENINQAFDQSPYLN